MASELEACKISESEQALVAPVGLYTNAWLRGIHV